MADRPTQPPPSPLRHLSVNDVRRSLQAVRRAWDANRPDRPMRLCLEILPGVSIARFCTDMTRQHHAGRTPVKPRPSADRLAARAAPPPPKRRGVGDPRREGAAVPRR